MWDKDCQNKTGNITNPKTKSKTKEPDMETDEKTNMKRRRYSTGLQKGKPDGHGDRTQRDQTDRGKQKGITKDNKLNVT